MGGQWLVILLWTVFVTMTLTGKQQDYFEYNAVIGAEVSIPCNITPPTPEDSISLVLWYKGDSGNPIYSVDARNVPAVAASHFASKQLGSRALFNMSNRIATLTIRPVKEDDGGEYRCRVDFRRARTQNRVMKLTIIVPPKNLTIRDDKNRTVSGVIGPYQEGATISLMCEAHGGRPAPVLSWWNGSKMIDDGYTPIGRGIVRNELRLLNLQREDLSATLTCQASNTNLTVPVSSSVTIDLSLTPLAVNIVTAYRPLSAGKELEVVCQTHGARPPARISWWVGSDNLDQLARESISIDGNTTTSYLLLRRTSDDNGKILICRAQNPDLPNSALQDKWILNIYFVPQLSLALGGSQKYGHIREGGDVYFDCNILANPPVSDVKWRFQSEELEDDPSKDVFIRNHSLQLKSVGRNNRGKYQCLATNVEGEGRSEEVQLSVQFAPVCRSGQKMVYGIARHEDANITCEVDADPAEVYFSWTFNNSAENIDIISNNNGGTKSTARYIPRTKMDYGVLYCRGRNIIGMQRDPCIFTIIPTGPPEPLQNCTIINQTASTLIVGCEAGDDGGLQQTFHLEVYGLAAEQLLVNMTTEDGPVFVAQGLISGSSYVLVVYSANNKGRSTSVALTASTIYSAEQRTGDEQPLAISAVLAVLMGLVGALVLLAIVIIFIMKTRGENDSSDMQQEHDQHEKIPAPITKQFEDDSPDVIPSKPFCTDYGNITPNATTERIYENVGEKDHTYENIISRVHFVPKEVIRPYDDITYAELALPDNQQPFVRHRLEPPTEYADIDFQNSRGTFPECQAVDDDDSARSPLVKPSPGGRVIPEDCPVSLSAV